MNLGKSIQATEINIDSLLNKFIPTSLLPQLENLSDFELAQFELQFNKELSEDRIIKLAAKENEELSEDRPIELAKEEKDEQDKPEELVFWTEGQVLRIFDEPEIIDLIKTSLWEKIKALIK